MDEPVDQVAHADSPGAAAGAAAAAAGHEAAAAAAAAVRAHGTKTPPTPKPLQSLQPPLGAAVEHSHLEMLEPTWIRSCIHIHIIEHAGPHSNDPRHA